MSWFKKSPDGDPFMINSNSSGRGSPPEPSPRRPEPREPRAEPRAPAPRMDTRAPEPRLPEFRTSEARVPEARAAESRSVEPKAPEAKAPEARGVDPTPRPSVLGPTLRFRGELSAQEDLIIQGSVEGSITHTQSLTIGTDGSMKGDIRARIIIVDGKVDGDLHATDSVSIRATAKVKGNVFAPRIAIAEGAFFKGQIDMQPSSPPVQEHTVRIRQLAAAGSTEPPAASSLGLAGPVAGSAGSVAGQE